MKQQFCFLTSARQGWRSGFHRQVPLERVTSSLLKNSVCYGLNCAHLQPICWTPNPQYNCIWKEGLDRVTKVKWCCKGGALIQWDCVCQSVVADSDSINCIPSGSSVHGILQARILEWVAIPFSRRYSRPRDQTWVSCIAGRLFTDWATRESDKASVFLKRGRDSLSLCTCAEKKSHGDTLRKAAFCKAGIETSQKPTLLAWICTSSLQKYEKMNFCCLNHPVCSILLWQLKQTNRGWKSEFYPQVCRGRPLPPYCKVSGRQGPAHGLSPAVAIRVEEGHGLLKVSTLRADKYKWRFLTLRP